MLRGLGFSFVAQLLAGLLVSVTWVASGARADDSAIVFIAPPALSTDLTDALDEAVSAQVSLTGARLVFLIAADDDSGLEERMSQAEALAQEHNAAGVFWIDARPNRRWFLYIMDRSGAHIVVRPLSVEGASMDAAIEAAAVIAGSASDALLKQQSLEERLAVPPPAAPPEAALRLELGYSGTVFAPSVPWINGLWVGAAWLWPSGPYFGLSYVWSPPVRVADDANEVTLEITRYPVWLQGGLRLKPLQSLLPRLDIAGELALGLEVRTRTTAKVASKLDAKDRETRATYLTSVRLVIEYRITDWLAVLARVSPELTLNGFDYMREPAKAGNPGLVYLSPYTLRFTAQLGLAIIR